MEKLSLEKSELLRSEPTKSGAGSRLLEEGWGEWASNHKFEIALAAGAVVAAAVGSRIILNRLGQRSQQAVLGGAESSAQKLSVTTAERLSSIEPRLTSILPPPSSTRLPEIAPGKVVPEAYSWGKPPVSTSSPLDSRALLDAIGAGQADLALQRLSAYERALKLAQTGNTGSEAGLAALSENAAAAQSIKDLSGQALKDAVLARSPSGRLATPQGLSPEWVAQHAVYDAGVSRTSAAAVEGAPMKELLGFEMAPGSRPLLEELIVDLGKSGTRNTFSRHMPGISRMEMPALSIRRKPPKEPL